MSFGPDRKEHRIRLVLSLAGLALMAVALARHGVQGIAWVEIVLFAGTFFGASALWSGWVLWRGRR